ncbi:MAG: hypothetical protein P1V19_09935 [Gimesia sp.]|nr:hypothetical protein [Gimesia sp.]
MEILLGQKSNTLMSQFNEHSTLGILKQVLRSKWFWGMGVLSVLILLTLIAMPAVHNYRVIQKIGALGGSFGVIEPDVNTVPILSKFRFNIWGNNTFIKLESISRLNLYNTSVSDSDLIWVSDFKNLESLNLGKSQVSDSGLIHLTGLKDLNYLDLSNTQITDAGLMQLKECSNLGTLYVKDTQVTEAGVAQLNAVLPDCVITIGP